MAKPLMAKATAVWLVDNTTLSFKQIADFCDLHELEVQGIADGDVAAGVKGFDPIANNQLEQSEIEKAEADPAYKLQLKYNPAAAGEEKRRGPRYTPLSKRQDRPAAILWLVKFHPELTDGQISKLVGTTKPTIQAIRERTHWNIQNIQPIDPVALGLCK
ncbi:MAG: cell cycle transcriptional regulator TrcR, partial [Pseudomonadota bacterium]